MKILIFTFFNIFMKIGNLENQILVRFWNLEASTEMKCIPPGSSSAFLTSTTYYDSALVILTLKFTDIAKFVIFHEYMCFFLQGEPSILSLACNRLANIIILHWVQG